MKKCFVACSDWVTYYLWTAGGSIATHERVTYKLGSTSQTGDI